MGEADGSAIAQSLRAALAGPQIGLHGRFFGTVVAIHGCVLRATTIVQLHGWEHLDASPRWVAWSLIAPCLAGLAVGCSAQAISSRPQPGGAALPPRPCPRRRLSPRAPTAAPTATPARARARRVHHLLGRLPRDVSRKLLLGERPLKLPEGETLFERGDIGDGCYGCAAACSRSMSLGRRRQRILAIWGRTRSSASWR